MQGYLMSEASLAEQASILTAVLCPEAPDVAACETGINENWSAIGKENFERGFLKVHVKYTQNELKF